MTETDIAEDQRSPNPLIASDRVQGTPVRRPDGEKIGQIERLMIDKLSGRVVYAVMSFGGFLGVGERYFTLPWAKLRYDSALDAYAVEISNEDLESAPALNSEGDTGPDRRAEKALHDYYETPPYWGV